MLPVVLGRDGYCDFLDAIVGGLNVYLHLFTSDVTPSVTSVKTDFVAPVYFNYAPLTAGKWTPAALKQGRAFSVSDPADFRYLSGPLPLPIRGYFATNGPTGRYLWGWRRPGDPFQFDLTHASLIVVATARFPVICP